MESNKKDQIIDLMKKYQFKTNVKGYVIGVSGGKDSIVVLKLACETIGNENIFALLMPNGDQKDLDDSISICKLFEVEYEIINIQDCYRKIRFEFTGKVMSRTYRQNYDNSCKNIAPRLRMTYLYFYAQLLGYRVLGTDNASERYIGWCTKWGDMACDFNPIAELTCTEVINLGELLKIPKVFLYKSPEDGITEKTDEDNFGFTYKQLDEYIKTKCITSELPTEDIKSKINIMHLNSLHKSIVHTLNYYKYEN